jgi:hypothetical protein
LFLLSEIDLIVLLLLSLRTYFSFCLTSFLSTCVLCCLFVCLFVFLAFFLAFFFSYFFACFCSYSHLQELRDHRVSRVLTTGTVRPVAVQTLPIAPPAIVARVERRAMGVPVATQRAMLVVATGVPPLPVPGVVRPGAASQRQRKKRAVLVVGAPVTALPAQEVVDGERVSKRVAVVAGVTPADGAAPASERSF